MSRRLSRRRVGTNITTGFAYDAGERLDADASDSKTVTYSYTNRNNSVDEAGNATVSLSVRYASCLGCWHRFQSLSWQEDSDHRRQDSPTHGAADDLRLRSRWRLKKANYPDGSYTLPLRRATGGWREGRHARDKEITATMLRGVWIRRRSFRTAALQSISPTRTMMTALLR